MPGKPESFGGVPLIDLSADTARQTVVDREPGQYLGHPTTALLEDGRTLLIVYPKGHGRGPIQYRRSTDGGKTWSGRLSTPKSWETSQETPTLHRVVDPTTGAKRLLLFSGLYPIRMARSEDDGKTWTELEPIGDYGGIVAMASLVRLNDGACRAFFHDDGRFFRNSGKASRFTVYSTLSRDGGLTWSEPVVAAPPPRAHLCEPGVVRSPDGRELAMLLRENSRTLRSHVCFSRDEGATWTEPRELPAALTGDRHVCAYAKDGRLLVTLRDMAQDSPTKGDWLLWVGRYEDLAAGKPGEKRLRLLDNKNSWDSAYAGLEVLPSGDIVTTTYGHWAENEPPYIVSVRLRPGEF
jgi:BNR/Asp-box repeat.